MFNSVQFLCDQAKNFLWSFNFKNLYTRRLNSVLEVKKGDIIKTVNVPLLIQTKSGSMTNNAKITYSYNESITIPRIKESKRKNTIGSQWDEYANTIIIPALKDKRFSMELFLEFMLLFSNFCHSKILYIDTAISEFPLTGFVYMKNNSVNINNAKEIINSFSMNTNNNIYKVTSGTITNLIDRMVNDASEKYNKRVKILSVSSGITSCSSSSCSSSSSSSSSCSSSSSSSLFIAYFNI